MKAINLQRIDKEFDIHLQAWANQQVQATKKQGKKSIPVYRTFKDFFDYERRINEVTKPKKKLTRLEELILKANS